MSRICKLCDASIPTELDAPMRALGGDTEAEALLGVAFAARQCDELLAGGAPGIHFYALNRAPGVRAVLSALRASRPWERARGRRRDRIESRVHGIRSRARSATQGHRITYDIYGEGDRVIVLVHGLLMNRRMYERLGPRAGRARQPRGRASTCSATGARTARSTRASTT